MLAAVAVSMSMLVAPQQPAPAVRLTNSAAANDWLSAAATHEPGREDDALRTIRQWAPAVLRRALKATADIEATDHLNDLLERAALLHADISLISRETGRALPAMDWGLPRQSYVVRDGEPAGIYGLDPHLNFARLVLRSMRPPAKRNETAAEERKRIREWQEAHARNPRIEQWFRAVTADLAARHWLGDLRPHLLDALAMVPHDARAYSAFGCMAELVAAPQIQQGLPRDPRPGSGSLTLRAESTSLLLDVGFNLVDAEKHYRTALKQAPLYDEARVRLARILLLRGNPRETIELLRDPLPQAEPIVRFYRAIVLADAFEETGEPQAARDAYENAASLFPHAQSPLVALVRLARQRADVAAAASLLSRLAALRPYEDQRFDPWWMYHDCSGRDRDREVERLYALFKKAPQ